MAMEELYNKLAQDPLVRRCAPYGAIAAGAFIGFQALKRLNRRWSQQALNHYTANSTWDWSKEIVVVTGGNSGVGEKIVERLARRGVKVIILDITERKAPLPPTVYAYQTDITSSEQVASAAARIRAEHGEPTVLINNAGIATSSFILDKPVQAMRQLFDVNFFSHIQLVKEFLPSMIKNDHGHIVSIASMASFASRAGGMDYAASKAAVLSWHQGLGQELALVYNAKRVRTSIVHPTWMRTTMTRRLYDTGKFHEDDIEPDTVAAAVVEQLYSGNSGQLILPAKYNFATGLLGFPHWFQEKIRTDLSANTLPSTLAAIDSFSNAGAA